MATWHVKGRLQIFMMALPVLKGDLLILVKSKRLLIHGRLQMFVKALTVMTGDVQNCVKLVVDIVRLQQVQAFVKTPTDNTSGQQLLLKTLMVTKGGLQICVKTKRLGIKGGLQIFVILLAVMKSDLLILVVTWSPIESGLQFSVQTMQTFAET